jgi:hypothetical protein
VEEIPHKNTITVNNTALVWDKKNINGVWKALLLKLMHDSTSFDKSHERCSKKKL